MSNLKDQVKTLMAKNRRHYRDFQYTVPSPNTYPHQWLWDSCFHAIILSYFDIKSAKKEILSLISKQTASGFIPHIIFWRKTGHRWHINWGKKKDHSSITQPPMIAYAVWRIFERRNDIQFLKEVYRSLFHFYKYLVNDRDPHERNLIGIINPDESGEDNSPRFDHVLNLPPVHSFQENLRRRVGLLEQNVKCGFDAPFCMKNFFWVKDVAFNAIMVENLGALAKIADTLEREYDAFYFREKRKKIIAAMRQLMLDNGIFWSTFGENYQKIKVKTWAIFSPLFAKIYTAEEAQKIINKYLLNKKEFKTEHPIPSTSLSEPSFNSADKLWRGPTWIATNWFVYKGLLNYGYQELAREIAVKSRKLLKKSGFREHFDPFTGEGQGASNFTWGGLILDMPTGKIPSPADKKRKSRQSRTKTTH